MSGQSAGLVEGRPFRAVLPALASDGRPPAPPPAPVRPLERCYAPRPDVSEFTLFPSKENSIFRSCQVVTYYGYPGVPGLGVLGEFDSDAELVAGLQALARLYDDANGFRQVAAGFHIIAAVAQANATPDGSYLARIPSPVIEHYIALAEANDFILFLDVQMGHSTIDAEIDPLLPYLRNPRVHLALDPEWATPPGVPPGAIIGGMDAGAINRAQQILQAVAEEAGLPSKILMVHQFTNEMIRQRESLADYPAVDLLIVMDGFGGRQIKVNHYLAYAADGVAEHGGMKLFIDEDSNIFTPADASRIAPQPDYITYQ